VIPQPPFADTLTPEEELRRFEELKPRLNQVWDVLMRTADQPGTSVVVPSLTLDQDELRKLDGATFYEERLLFLLIRLRNPRAHVVYVTSQPVHPLILDYYLHLLAGVPASHARARLTMLCTYDASPRALTQKILERPRLTHPRGDSRSVTRVPDDLQLHAARTEVVGAARHPAQRPGSDTELSRHQVGQSQGLSRGRGRSARRLRGPHR
jgi:hypothetical protein